MVFRRPRVNVKPNVPTTRPVSSIAPPPPIETVSSQSQDESCTQKDDSPVEPPDIKESTPNVVETHEAPSYSPVPLPTVQPFTSTLIPISSSLPPPSIPVPEASPPPSLPAPASPPPPPPPVPASTSPPPPSVPSPASPPPPLISAPSTVPLRRPFRRKVEPNIGVKSVIQFRRPSASCSGTESETESSRQTHALASSITYGRINPPAPKSTVTNETPVHLTPDISTNGDTAMFSKTEAIIAETPEIHTPPIESNNHMRLPLLPARTAAKVRHDYITQHINYRAQRLASKVEPTMTIRKRRAATLEKLDETGVNKGVPIDTSKLKIADFVHYIPPSNPMEVKPKTTKTDTTIDAVRKLSMSSTDGQSQATAPQLKIDANGSLVVDEESLYIRQLHDTPTNTVIVEGQFNDDNLTHRSHRRIGRRKRWNSRDTLRFYQALRMCGTDFTLISRVFPNRDRDDIKRKFKTEDKANRSSVDLALKKRIPFDLTCFYSPSEDSSESSTEDGRRKRRTVKSKQNQTTSSDPLEINRRREKRLQSKKNSIRIKKSAEFIDDDDEDDSSMDVADTVEVVTSAMESSKSEQIMSSTQNDDNDETTLDNSIANIAEFETLLGRIDDSHLLFVHNTDETTGLDRIDVHVVIPNADDSNNEQQFD